MPCLGHVEETFIGQLKPKDVFFFSGRQLEFVRLRDMTAYVKVSNRKSPHCAGLGGRFRWRSRIC